MKLCSLLAIVLAFTLEDTAAAAPAAPPQDARSFMASMSKLTGLQASFVETKTLALLKAPLVSRGVLYYLPPGYLVRTMETPSASTVRIGPERLQVEDAAGQQTFDLRSRPDIKTFVESFVHVMAGNYDALAAVYTLDYTPPPTPDEMWSLVLVPRKPPLSELVERLEVRGRGQQVATIRILERRGDRTEIEILDATPNRTFSARERRTIFGVSS